MFHNKSINQNLKTAILNKGFSKLTEVQDLVINETIYDSFTWVVLGCFGIAGAEKFAKKD